MALVAHTLLRAGVAPVLDHKVVAEGINHEPDDAVIGGRAGVGGGRRRGALGQVHPREQEAMDEEDQREEVQHRDQGRPQPGGPHDCSRRHHHCCVCWGQRAGAAMLHVAPAIDALAIDAMVDLKQLKKLRF